MQKKTFLFDGVKRLRELGITLEVKQGSLFVNPHSALSPAMDEWIKQHRDLLIAYCYEDQKVRRWCERIQFSDEVTRIVLGNQELRLLALEQYECQN